MRTDDCKANRHVTSNEREIYFPGMKTSDVRLREIPHCLAMVNRYNGFTTRPYSVAEHSVFVHELAKLDHGEGEVAKAALMHDAQEAYLGDISRPLKNLLPDYRRIEKHVEDVVREALGLPDPHNPIWIEVNRFDRIALMIEARTVLQYPYGDWVEDVDGKYWELRPMIQEPITWEGAKMIMSGLMRRYGWLL